jgi:hypothetical protein
LQGVCSQFTGKFGSASIDEIGWKIQNQSAATNVTTQNKNASQLKNVSLGDSLNAFSEFLEINKISTKTSFKKNSCSTCLYSTPSFSTCFFSSPSFSLF